MNQLGTIAASYPGGVRIENSDPNAPGVLNNDGLISTTETGIQILSDVVGTGTIQMNFIPHQSLGPTSLELGGAVAAGQTIELNRGGLQIDDPARFQGAVANFTDFASSILLENVTADAAQVQATGPSAATLVLTQAGSVVDSIALQGNFASTYGVHQSANATIVSLF